MAPRRNKASQSSTSNKKKFKFRQTWSTEWDPTLPPPPENQELIAQSNIFNGIFSILSLLDNSEGQISQRIT